MPYIIFFQSDLFCCLSFSPRIISFYTIFKIDEFYSCIFQNFLAEFSIMIVFFTNHPLDSTTYDQMNTVSYITRSHLGVKGSSIELDSLASSSTNSTEFCTAVSHTMLSSFTIVFCDSSHLMFSTLITTWTSLW